MVQVEQYEKTPKQKYLYSVWKKAVYEDKVQGNPSSSSVSVY